jgi:hypothetical protein
VCQEVTAWEGYYEPGPVDFRKETIAKLIAMETACRPRSRLYLGVVHRYDMTGNAARLAAARRHVRVDGVATECGMARGDPALFSELLAAHAKTAELASG